MSKTVTAPYSPISLLVVVVVVLGRVVDTVDVDVTVKVTVLVTVVVVDVPVTVVQVAVVIVTVVVVVVVLAMFPPKIQLKSGVAWLQPPTTPSATQAAKADISKVQTANPMRHRRQLGCIARAFPSSHSNRYAADAAFAGLGLRRPCAALDSSAALGTFSSQKADTFLRCDMRPGENKYRQLLPPKPQC